jgi:hypothetical protein
MFVEVFVEKSDILVKKLLSRAAGKDFDIYPFITRCALDIICGKFIRCDCHKDTNGERYITQTFQYLLCSLLEVYRHLDKCTASISRIKEWTLQTASRVEFKYMARWGFRQHNKLDFTIDQYSDWILLPTATCFGPHGAVIRQYYDRTAKVIGTPKYGFIFSATRSYYKVMS